MERLESSHFFTKNQKQNNRHCAICCVISIVYNLTDHIALDQSAREDSLSYCKILVR